MTKAPAMPRLTQYFFTGTRHAPLVPQHSAAMSKLDPLRQAVAVSPDNVPLLLLLAQACLDEWSHDEARGLFDRILVLDPQRPEAKVGVARVLHL